MLDRITPPPVYMMGDLQLPIPTTETLPNGIILRTISGGSQDVNQLTLSWVGGTNECHNPSIPKFTAQMLMEGTKDMTSPEISELLDFNGAVMRLVASDHHSSANVSVLNSKTLNILPLLRDVVTNPTFPEAIFKKYQDIEVKEFQLSMSKVMTRSMQGLWRMIKGKHHPESHVRSVEEIESVDIDDLRQFYGKVYTSSGLHAYLSGNITHEVLEETRTMLLSLPAPCQAMQMKLVPYETEPAGYHETELPGAVQAAVNIGIPAPRREDADYLPLRLTVIALGGYFGSRLMKNIREDKGYTYGIGAYLLGSREGSLTLISAQTDSKYVELLIDEVGKELHRLASEPLTDDEMLRLRQFVSSSLMETLDSPFAIMDYYKVIETVGLPPHYFDDQIYWVNNITKEKIMEMAGKYLRPEEMRISVCR